MIKKLINWVTLACVIGASVVIALVAAAFALFAALVPAVGQPWAAAIVAAVAAAIVGASALLHGMEAGSRRRQPEPEASLQDKLMAIARERPMLAAGAALAAGLVALKNPKLAAGLASAFMAGKTAEKVEHPKRRW